MKQATTLWTVLGKYVQNFNYLKLHFSPVGCCRNVIPAALKAKAETVSIPGHPGQLTEGLTSKCKNNHFRKM